MRVNASVWKSQFQDEQYPRTIIQLAVKTLASYFAIPVCVVQLGSSSSSCTSLRHLVRLF